MPFIIIHLNLDLGKIKQERFAPNEKILITDVKTIKTTEAPTTVKNRLYNKNLILITQYAYSRYPRCKSLLRVDSTFR